MVPAAFTLQTGKDHWELLLRARAVENRAFVVAPVRWGQKTDGRWTYGRSLIVDPWGMVLAQCQDRDGFALATLDLGYLDHLREHFPDAWAGPAPDPGMWERRMISGRDAKRAFVAVVDERVVVFAEFERDGHVDTLYVHHEFQGQVIASRLLDRIEAEARRLGQRRLFTEASITAEPFFRARGFSMVRPQVVEVRGHSFRNFVMDKVDL